MSIMAERGGAVVGPDRSSLRRADNVSPPSSVAQARPAAAVVLPSAAMAGFVAVPPADPMQRLVAGALPA